MFLLIARGQLLSKRIAFMTWQGARRRGPKPTQGIRRKESDARNPTQFLASFQKEVMPGRVYLEDKVSEMNLEYKDEQADE